MDDFLEALAIIIEVLLDGGVAISSNTKISKWIRYPMTALIILFYLLLIGGVTFIGICTFTSNIYLSIFLIICSLLLLIALFIEFKNIIKKTKNIKKI